jgi:hypothetical protein
MQRQVISDINSNLVAADLVYARATVIHDKTSQTLKVADGVHSYNTLPSINDPGAGTVTSVALTMPSIFTVGGSPVTGAGTLTAALATQATNTIFAAPNGSTGTPTFRLLVPADLGNFGVNGRVLTHNGSGGMSWVAPATIDELLPSQTGNGGKYLTTDGTNASWATVGGGGLTVGTTGITSGTVGRMLFQGTGNVLQQSANIFWDNTNNRLSVGQGASPAATVDIKAPGTTVSDISLRVRNNGGTANNFEVTGNGRMFIGGNSTGNGLFAFDTGFAGSGYFLGTAGTFTSSNAYLQFFTGGFKFQFGATNDGFQYNKSGSPTDNWYFQNKVSGATRQLAIGDTAANIGHFIFYGENFGITDQSTIGTTAKKVFWIKNGTAPPTGSGLTDLTRLYSADIAAGHAALHILNENDTVIKLYQQTTAVSAAARVHNNSQAIHTDDTFDGYTMAQIVKALRNNGLLA